MVIDWIIIFSPCEVVIEGYWIIVWYSFESLVVDNIYKTSCMHSVVLIKDFPCDVQKVRKVYFLWEGRVWTFGRLDDISNAFKDIQTYLLGLVDVVLFVRLGLFEPLLSILLPFSIVIHLNIFIISRNIQILESNNNYSELSFQTNRQMDSQNQRPITPRLKYNKI